MNRFQDNWMEDDAFKEWLVKVSNDESRAYCRFCAIVLRAHKTDLALHSQSLKHISNAKIAVETGAPAAPISVQIVCNDNDVEEENDETGVTDRPVTDQKPIIPKRKRSATTGSSRKKSTSYRKKYRPEWEEAEELKDWLLPYPKNESKAFCKRCGVLLRAHKHDLLLHSRSVRHKNCSGKNVSISDIELSRGDLDDNFHSNVTPKRTKQEMSVSDHDDGTMDGDTGDDNIESIIGFEMNDSNDDQEVGEGDSTTSPVIRETKKVVPVKLHSTKYHPPAKRRNRINAADVVAAIENNEFTGYELLQLVKVCVPKL